MLRGLNFSVLLKEVQVLGKADLRDIGYEDARWMELTPIVVLVSATLKVLFLFL